jgi:tetrahydromethanopterin S-methyltransferase subunit C
MIDLIWSFAPWLVFLLATRVTSFYGAIAAALVVAVVVLGRAVSRHRLHMLDVASLLYFLALGAVLVLLHPGHLENWSRYAQAGSHAALTVILFGSILVRHPFTESYARETTPRESWPTPEFRAINRQISAVWGLAFLIGTVSLIIAGSVDARQMLLRVVVPFGALAWAYKYTQRKTRSARDTTDVPSGTETPAAFDPAQGAPQPPMRSDRTMRRS